MHFSADTECLTRPVHSIGLLLNMFFKYKCHDITHISQFCHAYILEYNTYSTDIEYPDTGVGIGADINWYWRCGIGTYFSEYV